MKKILLILLMIWGIAYGQCDTVTNLTISNRTATGARVSYTGVTGASAYAWVVRVTGVVYPFVATGSTTSTTINLTGLQPNVSYTFQIETLCGVSASDSSSITFSTLSSSIVYTPMTAAGYQFKYLKADSGFSLPLLDTSLGRGSTRAGQLIYRPNDGMYVWNGSFWNKVRYTGGTYLSIEGTDTLIWQGGSTFCTVDPDTTICYDLSSYYNAVSLDAGNDNILFFNNNDLKGSVPTHIPHVFVKPPATWDSIGVDSFLLNPNGLTNGLLAIGGVSVLDSTITIVGPTIIRRNDTTYSIPGDHSFIINSADAGNYRTDIIWVDSFNVYQHSLGTQGTYLTVPPDIPYNGIQVLAPFVFGNILTPGTTTPSAGGWLLTGNNITDSVGILGSTNARDVKIVTSGRDRIRFGADGKIYVLPLAGNGSGLVGIDNDGLLSFSAGGGGTNFANTDLAFTGHRTHNASGYYLKIDSTYSTEINTKYHPSTPGGINLTSYGQSSFSSVNGVTVSAIKSGDYLSRLYVNPHLWAGDVYNYISGSGTYMNLFDSSGTTDKAFNIGNSAVLYDDYFNIRKNGTVYFPKYIGGVAGTPIHLFGQDATGKMITVSTSGIGTDSTKIPLEGTQPWQKVTGAIQMTELSGDGSQKNLYIKNEENGNTHALFFEGGGVGLISTDSASGQQTKLYTQINGGYVSSDNPSSFGLRGVQDFSANLTGLDYPQVNFVLNRIDSALATIGSGSGWSLAGNASTTPGTNFIGTTDDNPLILKTNNAFAGIIDHFNGNTSFGAGSNAALDYTSTFGNTSFGNNNLLIATIAGGNVLVGQGILANGNNFNNNAIVGSSSFAGVDASNRNSGLGNFLGNNLTTANDLVLIGYGSVNDLVSGNSSIAIGSDASFASTSSYNEIVIGDSAAGHGSNTATFGNASTTDNYFTGNIYSGANKVLTASNFVRGETPSGTVNGVNQDFTLAFTPALFEDVWVGGVHLNLTTHYTVTGITLHFITAPSSDIKVNYIK